MTSLCVWDKALPSDPTTVRTKARKSANTNVVGLRNLRKEGNGNYPLSICTA
jgi:hypothetical protein